VNFLSQIPSGARWWLLSRRPRSTQSFGRCAPGELKLITGRTFPKTLGSDFAGVVERLPALGVTEPSVGARVYGSHSDDDVKPVAHAERLAVGGRIRLRLMPKQHVRSRQAAACRSPG